MVLPDAPGLLAAWQLGPIQSLCAPATGSINQIIQVLTERGEFFLRCYRHSERRRIEDEHAIIAHVIAKGIPAVAPMPVPEGGTIVEHDSRYYALFPRAPGVLASELAIGVPEAWALGAFLAELHRTLHNFPIARVQQRAIRTDTAATQAAITRYETHIQSLPQPTSGDRDVLLRLAGQRAWIERHPDMSMAALESLECQPIHGDYNLANLFLNEGRVSAIIDWDQAYSASRAWEVIRTLDIVFHYAPGYSQQCIEGYRSIQPLTLPELDCAAACYGLMRAHDLWMYEAIYDQGNERVRAFIDPHGFLPHGERWANVRRLIN